jgi:hypothetical protein
VPITDAEVVALLPELAEAARASQRTVERFVPPRIGIVEETSSRRHQFILGRRGVGKSSLLRTVEKHLADQGSAVVFVDLETLRGVPYPDVLIQLLIDLLAALDGELKRTARELGATKLWRNWTIRWQVRRLARDFQNLLAAPQSAQHTVKKLNSRASRRHLAGSLDVSAALQQARGRIGGGFSRSTRAENAETEDAQFERTKMDGLYTAAPLVRSVLTTTMQELFGRPAFIILDDFYHIAYDDQPKVLAYLHQVIKNLEIYLKICGVRHRLNPFVEGDPPIGLQMGQDAGSVSLDVTLENFAAAQSFLEQVLGTVFTPAGVDVDDVLTDGGKVRLVLGSGGVARDYLNLTHLALRASNERIASTFRPHNRITAEDVNESSAKLSEEKQNDLRLDSGPNADRLRERLSDVVRFCLDSNGTNVFLVDGPQLQETDWGKEVQSLADLRLVHEIGNISIQSSDYRGRRFVGFTLDLSSYTGTRSESIRQIEFWDRGGKSQLRRAGLIYDPTEGAGRNGGGSGKAAKAREPVDWSQPPLPGIEE